MQCVEAGGHDVPDEKLEARFPRTIENAAQGIRITDLALVIANSRVEQPVRFVEAWGRGARLEG